MKKLLFAVMLTLGIALPAMAEQAVPQSNTQILNQTIQTCMTSMAAGLKDMSPELRGLVVGTMADTCRKTAVVAPEKPEGPGLGHYLWDGFKFVAGLHYGYKGQQLVFNALTGVAERGLSATENISTKSMEHLAEKPQVIISNTTPEGASILYPRPLAGEN